jgi:hypothetical protein
MARIAILTFTEVARDPRVMRHVAALQGHHEIVTCGKGPAPDGVVQHLAIPDDADHLPLTLGGLVALGLRRSRWAYRNLPAARAAEGLLTPASFDLLISNDITALPVALEVAGSRPVLADLHEYAPREMEEDWRWRAMVQPFAEQLCRDYLPRAAAVTTVAEGIAQEYRAQYGVDPVTITNASAWREPQPRPVGRPIRAVHSGMATPNRHLDRTIRAAAEVEGLALDLFLVPSTRARSHLDDLRSLAAATSNVRVMDPVPMEAIGATLDSYDLGVFVLSPTSFNYLHALPNKLFDFIQSGLGVLIGPSPEMAALTRQYSFGRVLQDFEERTLRAAFETLNQAEVARWKRAACASSEALSSAEQAQRMRDLVAGLTG